MIANQTISRLVHCLLHQQRLSGQLQRFRRYWLPLRCLSSNNKGNSASTPTTTTTTTTLSASTSTTPPHTYKEPTIVYSRRTPITTAVWAVRERHLREAKLSNAASSGPVPRKILVKKPMDSLHEFIFEFSKDPALRAQYLNPYGSLRIGNILEDVDALAGVISYAHCDDNNPLTAPLTIVTASCDRIDLLNRIPVFSDLRYRGFVSWVGRSSMEVRIEIARRCGGPLAHLTDEAALAIMQGQMEEPVASDDSSAKQNNTAEDWESVILCYFTMVARDPITNQAVQVNQLAPQTPEERQWQAEGEEHNRIRKIKRELALSVQPPTREELALIHQIFMDSSQSIPTQKSSLGALPMSSTEMNSVEIAYPQEQNIHKKLFGGFLMRRAFELAWAAAHMHSQSRPRFLALDDVMFLTPVEIGAIISFKAKVVFVPDVPYRALLVAVSAKVADPLTSVWRTSNMFYFTFHVPDSDKPIRAVIPETYTESMDYLEGRRRWESSDAIRSSTHILSVDPIR